MKKQETIQALRDSKPLLIQRYGVSRLALFGSMARDTATSASDIDILVSFQEPASSNNYFGVQFYLEDLFGRRVDLVTDKALRSELRPYVESEAIDV